ncbi:helix-turn-helix domain-containing protein [Streptomyces olivaceus]|uniref:helix-turn-helix domain-containing protein n=1 Tax=Streptomyces olivaceus TaxID=47716 RepID=UPI001CCEBCB0|nr:helix-turn-helix domain-containing protein [Streptomyces olivaceus]MBZ6142456.1 helix-turn-helix domain-containing protein [Streptomyces olivaceus]MBZ6170175.1 helix-turn-helix domain-containing protein [Streptomyces olivaceus]MBZ6260595.1 helix-turn-helix domain-containing protein [Streptomyces olivaceus]
MDELLSRPTSVLPQPEVRARLRKASGLTQEEVARAFGVHRMAFLRWENGQAVPRAKHRAAYLRLLKGWAKQHPQAAGGFTLSEAS